MKKITRLLCVFVAGMFAATAALAEFDGSEPLVCSFGHVIECDAGSECRAVTNESVDAPDFLKLDFKKKQVVATTAGQDSPPDSIDNLVDLTTHLVVQGVQGTSKGDTLGWSMSIDQETGQMVVTGAGDHAGFVIFGACAPI